MSMVEYMLLDRIMYYFHVLCIQENKLLTNNVIGKTSASKEHGSVTYLHYFTFANITIGQPIKEKRFLVGVCVYEPTRAEELRGSVTKDNFENSQ